MSDKRQRKKQFLRTPSYPGGTKALAEFIQRNLRYPTEALARRVEGDVHVAFEVDEEGVVHRARIVRGIGAGCDEEALRLVSMLRYKPVRNRGVKVTSHMDLVIHFRLPQAQPVQIVYHYRSSGDSS
ncbi:MAG: energy transducer TonB [Chlorobi bacterium]|jgi:TonB family protein|nr:energy transducer TonB [Chlorobiota bacterium]